MRVIRGETQSLEADTAVTISLLERTAHDRTPVVRVWHPHRQVAFGRRDTNARQYDSARQIARREGFEPVERTVGGRAVAHTGTTVAFARCVPIDDPRTGLNERYESTSSDVRTALVELGVDARRGEPDDSFCPGTHSFRANGKLVGIAQRVRNDAALVSGIVLVRDHGEIARVLSPVYDALEVPFDPQSVGSLARAGGETDPAVVRSVLEDALTGTSCPSIEWV
ncbi:lipoate--protein ligase family protein [Natrarchaeobius halalkaliphilus]|uniref:Lipoate--protein ligase family protein n=1 Tax=Natrarchaeobius halalkaliphilus TaxID=1679091 RepID=A0A3N6LHR0_9EURY|nr:lipoate--protein ligase family protein [Natrarchaeobius halalkaliphilus]RQG86724.1 lipoate--protein ligase family protein [Natrarchaeobius halalkaliphilus]